MEMQAALLLCLVCVALGDDVLLQKRMSSGEPVEQYDQIPAVKKPFCNAFTGCGKRSGKRSESLDSLVDLNAEPAVEDLRRQILSEAKLWEAIQEARMELGNRQRQEESEMPARPIPFPLTGGHKRSQYYYT